jgi:outer membrane protein assembly factor BamB
MLGQQSRISQQVGEYRLRHRLGQGSFGIVYQAEHVHDGSQTAVKLLQLQLTRYQDLKGFLTEARTIRLHHPHIVSLLDFGLSHENIPYLVMEYATGGSLRDQHPAGSPLPLSTISSYVSQLASALQYAHDHHVIHRDIKPQNILLRADGSLLLSDFGMAEVMEQSNFGRRSGLVGTPAYMAPEQSLGLPKPASDQYALAVLTYEWLTGRLPFQATTPKEVVEQHRFDTPPSLRKLRPELPPQVAQVISQALAKRPEKRFTTVKHFDQALQAALAPSLSMMRKAHLRTMPPITSPSLRSTSLVHVAVPPRSRQNWISGRAWLIVLTCLVLLAGIGGAEIWMALAQHHLQKSDMVTAAAVTSGGTTSYDTTIATNGVQFGFDAQHSRNNPYEQEISLSNVSQLSKEWSFQTGLFIRSSPAVANGLIYVGSDDHNLYALDASNGQIRWTFQTGGMINSSPAVSGGLVYVGSADNILYALDASTGQIRWTFQTGGIIKSSPAVSGGLVYVGSADNNLYALDAANGQIHWTFQTGGAINSSPAVANGLVYIGSADNSFYALDASTGQRRWTFQTGGAINSSPAVANDLVYIGSTDKCLYALDASNGQMRWTFQTGGTLNSSPAVANGLVYIGSADENLYALNASNGKKRGIFLIGSAITSSPMLANGLIYIGSSDDILYVLNASNGQKRWTFQAGGFIDSSPMVANGVIYVGSADDNLYAFHVRA